MTDRVHGHGDIMRWAEVWQDTNDVHVSGEPAAVDRLDAVLSYVNRVANWRPGAIRMRAGDYVQLVDVHPLDDGCVNMLIRIWREGMDGSTIERRLLTVDVIQ